MIRVDGAVKMVLVAMDVTDMRSATTIASSLVDGIWRQRTVLPLKYGTEFDIYA